MNSQRRMYFKKQIMKNLSQQENNNTNLNETYMPIYPNTKTAIDTAAIDTTSIDTTTIDTAITGLENLSHNRENDRVLITKTILSNEENITCLDGNPGIAAPDLEDGDLHTKIFENIVDRKKHNTENNQDLESDKENDDVTLLGSPSYHQQNQQGISKSMSIFDENNCENIQKEIQNTTTGPESAEIQPTFTEIIAENEMDLMRKSLEEDAIDNAEGMDSIINLLEKNQDKSENNKSKRSQIKKSYIDILSDEEDFVWDSSSWKETGDECSSDESNKPRKKKIKRKICAEDGKVGNAGLRQKKENKRKMNKMARDKGQSYIKKNGSIVKNRSMNPNPCFNKTCGNNCSEISDEKRKNIFDHFWSLSPQRKKDWLIGMASKIDIKRRRSKEPSIRNNTFNYFVNDGEGRRKVCKKFLIETLGISLKYLFYTLSNSYLGSSINSRGTRVPVNKTPQTIKESAINFIKSLPALPSHYCRKDSTRLYLPTDIKNLKNLYRIYKESQTSMGIDVVGEKVFREIFTKNFNIGFHVPKKDKCLKCLRFQGKDVNDNNEMLSHLKEKEASKNRLIFHRELAKKNQSILCTSFDLQKVLNTPHGHSMLLFYARKYTVYNLCFYESSTRAGFCYTWGETEGKRGGNEISTILQKYIANVDSRGHIKKLILYSDSCPGQNKNKIVLSALHNALLQAQNIETIQINYLLPGHTEMTVDSIHATIENSVRNTIIWAPSQWATVFQLARKDPSPYNVECLVHTDFKNFEEFSERYFRGNLTGKISKIRIATFRKSTPDLMSFKTSMQEDAEDNTVAIISRPKQLNQKYKTALPLTTTKFNDLKKLCDTGVIPTVFHFEYFNFIHSTGKDNLAETDIEDEFGPE